MSAHDTLQRQLGSDLTVLDELTEDEASELLELIETARTSQQKTLDEAIDAALAHLPKLARMPARRIMFG